MPVLLVEHISIPKYRQVGNVMVQEVEMVTMAAMDWTEVAVEMVIVVVLVVKVVMVATVPMAALGNKAPKGNPVPVLNLSFILSVVHQLL